MTIQIFGLPVSRGVAMGRAVLVASSRVDVAHYFIEVDQIDAEVGRLRTARDVVRAELLALQKDLPAEAPQEISALLDVHLMLLDDDMLSTAVKQWVVERRYNAEWALSAQLEVIARQFDEMDDAYIRERKADMEQVTERMLTAMLPSGAASQRLSALGSRAHANNEPLVLVAADVAPADMLQFKRSVFQGFVTDVGGKTSHTAIVARSLDIPAVVGAREASRLIRQDDWVIVDGDAGVIIVDPSPIVLEEYRFRQQQAVLEHERLKRLRHTPAVTLDGEKVELLANIELPGDARVALEAGATGIGLFRSEFLFMNRSSELPGEDEQYEAYREVVQTMKGLPVTIRTIDVGADKPIDRMTLTELRRETTMNPALGLRAIRWSLSEPHMFRVQLRAILRAAAHGNVRLLMPMVAHRSEALAALGEIRRARQQLTDAKVDFGEVKVGAMIEVPAAALTIKMFAQHFDFFSLGTNDLIQYTLAIDRADEQVAHLYDPWHPAVLRLIHETIEGCKALGKGVSVCGEMAGDVAFTDVLLAMGLRTFSMHPACVALVKQRLLRLDTRRLTEGLDRILASDDPGQAAQAAYAAPIRQGKY
jgi:phosphoenolpyruvate-protein phosphotransferase (PTS system enzyme I)